MSDDGAILYVLSHHPRPTQTFIQAEIDALRAAGSEVLVVALNEPSAVQLRSPKELAERDGTLYLKQAGRSAALRALRRALQRDPLAVIRVWLQAVASGGTDVRRWLWRSFHFAEALVVWDHARDHGVTHIHAHFGQSTSTIAWLAARLAEELGCGASDLVITIHGGSEVEDPAESIPDHKARTARAIVAISDHTRSQIMRHIDPSLWSKVQVIRCGVDLEFFSASEREAPTVQPTRPTVVFVGRLDPVKGVSLLIDACARLVAAGRDLQLVVVGAGMQADELRRSAEGTPWITFAGELLPDGVRETVLQADVFCLPSFDEGIPVSIMEAMAVGVPVVATAVAGIPELAVDGETAIVVPPGNVDALATGLARILDDDELRQRVIEGGRARVSLRHDARRNLPELVALVRDEVPESPGTD